MPDIYLRHPIHGEKVEHNEVLAQMDRANGWVIFDPTVKPEPAVVIEPVVAPVAAAIPDFLKGAVPTAPKPKATKKPEG